MTDNNHPITPPPELVEQWECEYHHMTWGPDMSMFLTEKAARWGADQELDACISAVLNHPGFEQPELFIELLRAARRPKPQSLKEQALAVLDDASDRLDAVHENTIRRALESLPD